MSKQNVMIDSLLDELKRKEEDTSKFLNGVSLERERREYRDDILQLSSTDISLLTFYYMNSNEEAQRQFLNLVNRIYSNKKDTEQFMTEFRNLYYLSKSGLTTLTQYGAAKRVILDFVNRLKDEALSEKKIDHIKEKEYADRLLIIRKFVRYFSAKPGTVEVKNIDNFMMMLNILNFSYEVANNALIIAIENNNKFYSKSLLAMKKNTDSLDLD